jgi:hypothetical protein
VKKAAKTVDMMADNLVHSKVEMMVGYLVEAKVELWVVLKVGSMDRSWADYWAG